jgi:hypothetical protein
MDTPFPTLTIAVPVDAQKKSSGPSRILILNAITLPLQVFIATPLLMSRDPIDNQSGIMLILMSEVLILVILSLFFALIRKPRFNRPWNVELSPYQLALQNGAVPTYLVKQLSYRRKSFLHEDALILNWQDSENLLPMIFELNLHEKVYKNICQQVNSYLSAHQTEIVTASRTPLSEVIVHMQLPIACRMQLQQKGEMYEVHLPAALEHLRFYDQTVLVNPGQFHSQGRAYLRFSNQGLEYKNGSECYSISWKELSGVRVERVEKYETTSIGDETRLQIRYYNELTLYRPEGSLILASVFEPVNLLHQLVWLRDLILRQQHESLTQHKT